VMNRKILITGEVVILICLIGGIFLWQMVFEQTPQLSTQLEKEELKLSEFPEAFKDSTLIVIGNNASEIEMKAVNKIVDYLENETGNKPLIKKYSKISDEDKRNYNLIIIGTPKTNPFLEEVYAITGATRVTEEYPGEYRGFLEILRNPWDERKAVLLVAGWDERGLFSIMEYPLFPKGIHTIRSPTFIIYPPRPTSPIFVRRIDTIQFYIGLFLIGLSIGVGTRVKRKILWIPILMFLIGVFLLLSSFEFFGPVL